MLLTERREALLRVAREHFAQPGFACTPICIARSVRPSDGFHRDREPEPGAAVAAVEGERAFVRFHGIGVTPGTLVEQAEKCAELGVTGFRGCGALEHRKRLRLGTLVEISAREQARKNVLVRQFLHPLRCRPSKASLAESPVIVTLERPPFRASGAALPVQPLYAGARDMRTGETVVEQHQLVWSGQWDWPVLNKIQANVLKGLSIIPFHLARVMHQNGQRGAGGRRRPAHRWTGNALAQQDAGITTIPSLFEEAEAMKTKMRALAALAAMLAAPGAMADSDTCTGNNCSAGPLEVNFSITIPAFVRFQLGEDGLVPEVQFNNSVTPANIGNGTPVAADNVLNAGTGATGNQVRYALVSNAGGSVTIGAAGMGAGLTSAGGDTIPYTEINANATGVSGAAVTMPQAGSTTVVAATGGIVDREGRTPTPTRHCARAARTRERSSTPPRTRRNRRCERKGCGSTPFCFGTTVSWRIGFP